MNSNSSYKRVVKVSVANIRDSVGQFLYAAGEVPYNETILTMKIGDMSNLTNTDSVPVEIETKQEGQVKREL